MSASEPASYSSGRKTLTPGERREQNDRCCIAFRNAGINPYLMRTVYEDGERKQKCRRMTETHDTGPGHFDYFLTKNWVSLPIADNRRSKAIARQLRRVCYSAEDLWTGMATSGPLCTVDGIGKRQRELMTRVRRFFSEQRRFQKGRHI